MIRNVALALFVAASASAQEAPPASVPPSPEPEAVIAETFPSEVELVTVDVVVTDKKNQPITGLPKDAFVLEEDGQRQEIVSFEPVVLPADPPAEETPQRPRISTNTTAESRTARTFVIVFDDVHLTPFQARRAKVAVAEFLKRGVREGDRVALVATGGGAWWSTRMMAGREELMTLLKRLDGRLIPDRGPDRMTEYEALRIHMYQDPLVEARVSRRFETYGVSMSDRFADRRDDLYRGGGDPMVRARASDVYFQSVARNRITLQVMERLLLSLASARGRKSMLLVSEGFVYDPHLDEFKDVVQASRRANVAVYFLDTRGLEGMPTYASAEFGPMIDNQDVGAAFGDAMEASAGAESIAADTGGFSVKNTNDLDKGVLRIADESRAYYLLGYNPTNRARDGRFRKIELKIEGKGLKARYRKGYYAPLDGTAPAGERPVGTDPDIQAALDSPYEERRLPLRMTHYVFEETLLGKASVLLVTEVDLNAFAFEESEGRFQDTLEFLLVAAHRESGEYFRYDQQVEMKLLPQTKERLGRSWYPIVRDFELAPGGYQAKIVVRDKNSGRIGTVVHEFEVPDLGSLRVSTPSLSDVLQPTPEGEQGPPRAALIARRTFAPDATLYSQFEVYGAAKDTRTGMPHVKAGFIIRRKDGSVFTRAEPTVISPTSLGKLSRLVGAPLSGAPPGEYELVLTLQDEIAGKSLELREPFTVVPPTATAQAPPAAEASAGTVPAAPPQP